MAPSFQKNFQFQGRPEAWKPLADTTVEIRGSKTPILQRSGLLAKTVQQLNIWTVGIEDASIQDLPQKVWYGKVHQGGYGSPATKSLVKAKGSSGGKKTAYVPQRPFLLIQPEDVVAIEGVFMAWFIERMTMSGAFRPGL
jgi:phage gpG-like protein